MGNGAHLLSAATTSRECPRRDVTEDRSHTEFWGMFCQVGVAHVGKVLTYRIQKTNRHAWPQCQQRKGEGHECSSQPEHNDQSAGHVAFMSTLEICALACLGSGVQQLQRCGAFRDDSGSDGSSFSKPEAGIDRQCGVISREITAGSISGSDRNAG